MRRRRSTRSVIKLLAAAAATASIVGLVRLSTPPAELPLCEDIEEIDTKVITLPPRQGNAPRQLMDFLRAYINEGGDGGAAMATRERGGAAMAVRSRSHLLSPPDTPGSRRVRSPPPRTYVSMNYEDCH